jgi:hypothetical protein
MSDNKLTRLFDRCYIDPLLDEQVMDLLCSARVNDIETFFTLLQTHLQEGDDRVTPILIRLINKADMVVGLQALEGFQ